MMKFSFENIKIELNLERPDPINKKWKLCKCVCQAKPITCAHALLSCQIFGSICDTCRSRLNPNCTHNTRFLWIKRFILTRAAICLLAYVTLETNLRTIVRAAQVSLPFGPNTYSYRHKSLGVRIRALETVYFVYRMNPPQSFRGMRSHTLPSLSVALCCSCRNSCLSATQK